MSQTDQILQRLRDEDHHLESLVRMVLDQLMDRPVAELIEPKWTAQRLVEGIRSSVDDPQTRQWIRARLLDLRARMDDFDGPLLYRARPELTEPIKAMLRRPYLPNPDVVRALVDHKAMRELMRGVLTQAITEYASKIKVPDAARKALGGSPFGKGRLAQLAGAASVAAKMVGSEVERQLEHRIRDFVDEAIGAAIDRSVQDLCDPRKASDFGDMRADAVDKLLAFRMETWRREFDKQDLDTLIEDLAGTLAAVAHSEAFAEELSSALESMVQQSDGRSLRDFLQGSGLEDSWRPHVEELLIKHSRQVVATPAFASWLRDLIEPA